MARKAFETFEAVSAVVPREGGYHAAIATKAIGGSGAPRFHKVLEEQTFKTAREADEAATRAGRRRRSTSHRRRNARRRRRSDAGRSPGGSSAAHRGPGRG